MKTLKKWNEFVNENQVIGVDGTPTPIDSVHNEKLENLSKEFTEKYNFVMLPGIMKDRNQFAEAVKNGTTNFMAKGQGNEVFYKGNETCDWYFAWKDKGPISEEIMKKFSAIGPSWHYDLYDKDGQKTGYYWWGFWLKK